MAAGEVTQKMILDYMCAKGGVVRNTDLVRHFKKYLQLSDKASKDRAREQFKHRVNEVAYIKADSQGEKYLYLKSEHQTAGQSNNPRDSIHPPVSKRDSAHSILSKRDSVYSILSETPPSHNTTRSPAHHVTANNSRTSVSSTSPGHSSTGSTTTSPHRPSNSTSGQPGYKSGLSGDKSGQSNRASAPKEPSLSTGSTSLSLLGDSLLSDSTLNSFFGGGTSTTSSGLGGGSLTTPTATTANTGGDSSFSSDIFGKIGGSFWGSSESTTATTSSGLLVGEERNSRKPPPTSSSSSSVSSTSAPPPPPPSHQSSSSPSKSKSTNRLSSPGKKGTSGSSRGSGSGSTNVTLQSYKPLSSPPRYASPPPPPAVVKEPSSPPPPLSPPYSSSSSSQSRPKPPQRNPSYSTTYNKPSSNKNITSLSSSTSSGTSGSVFSPPPKTSTTEGSSLLGDLTSDLGSFGEIGSLLDSFGDFSSLKGSSQKKTPPSSSAPAPPTRSSQTMASSAGRGTGPLTSSSGSTMDRSSVTLMSESGRRSPPPPPPAAAPPAPTSSSSSSSPPSHPPPPPPSQGSPAKNSSSERVRRTPPPAPGSPMRVPRSPRGGGPSETSPSPLTRRQSSLERLSKQDGSPRIHIQRADSAKSNSPSNGTTSPPHTTGGGGLGVGGGEGRVRSMTGASGLPPLPPSAMLGPAADRRSAAATTNGGVGVIIRPQQRDRVLQSSQRRSKNLDTLTRASIMMTPPSVRRPAPGGSCTYGGPAPSSSGEDLSQMGDQDGSSAPSDEYELDPLEKEWMLGCAAGDRESLLTLIIRDDTLINRKDFLHGYTALHWAAKLGRCDIMSALIINGAFPNIKSNGGFTALHLACQGGYDNAIAMLVRDHGANVNVRDNSGRKPVDMLNYSCPDSIRGLLMDRHRGKRSVALSSEYLPSFSQPRGRLASLTNTWASMPNSLESSDEKKKRVSPKMSKRTFSFRNKHKLQSPGHEKRERPRSHIPETYDA